MPSIVRRRVIGKEASTPLPPHTPLQYIQSDGSAYINTGIACTDDAGFEAEMQMVSIGNSDSLNVNLIGGELGRSDGQGRWGLNIRSNLFLMNVVDSLSALILNPAGDWQPFYTDMTPVFSPFTISYKNEVVSMNGSSKSAPIVHSAVPVGGLDNINIFLFRGSNSTGTGAYGNSVTKMFSCKIYKGNTVVRDFIPCLDENNVYCLLDKVSGQFFYNLGSGSFTGE